MSDKPSHIPDPSSDQSGGMLPPAKVDPLDATIAAIDEDNSPDQEFFVPLHGFVWFTKAELKIINHPAFQRLGDVNQLGQAHLVFRGATHKRIEHCLGAVHVAQTMMDEIDRNHARLKQKPINKRDRPLCSDTFSLIERAYIRLAALLHDVGHLPAGHTLEDEIKVLNKHESLSRLKLIFERTDWAGGKTSSLEDVVNDAYGKILGGSYSKPKDVLFALIAKHPENGLKLPREFRLQVARDLVGNTICADFLDYIHRDWYHIGKPRHMDERLYHYMELRKDTSGESALVISLGDRSKLRSDAITAIVGLLDSRYQLAETVLFHRTKCAAAAMLERGIQELRFDQPVEKRPEWDKNLERRFLDYTDSGAVRYLLYEAEKKKAGAAILPLRSLVNREIYATIATAFFQQVEPLYHRLLDKFITPDLQEEDISKAETVRLNRLSAMRFLERDFGLPDGSLVMYFPSRSMNAKIPQVKIHVDGDIKTFEDWNTTDSTKLDGGHLRAQIIRFQRLWRTHVSLLRSEFEKIPPAKLRLLKDAVDCLVFDMCKSNLTAEEAALDIAERARSTPGMPFTGIAPIAVPVGHRWDEKDCYPFGAPTLNSIFKK